MLNMWMTVTKKAQRPARMDGKCFYCQQQIGGNHKRDCVLIQKTVKVRVVIEYDISVPYFWTKEDIEFHRNKSSWCSDNLIEELQELADEGDGCLCSKAVFECLDSYGSPVKSEE